MGPGKGLFRREGADGVHDFVRQVLVCIFSFGVEFRRREGDGVSHRDRDGAEPGKPGADGKGFIRTADAQGLHGNFRFAQDEADPAHAVMDFTIRRAGAFRKHEYALAGFQQAYHVLEAGGIRVFLVNGDSLAEGQGPFENALEQRLACEK